MVLIVPLFLLTEGQVLLSSSFSLLLYAIPPHAKPMKNPIKESIKSKYDRSASPAIFFSPLFPL